MRWDNLKVETQEAHTLPGYREPAAVRTFDAPEAMDVRFYEVQAKSVLNRVPKASRMPFRWTINPYRGCTHACQFCMGGATPILLSDGRHKPLAEVRPGDWVFGTRRLETYRHYAVSQVTDHWVTHKLAYRVTLDDGTELVASGDHRFLTGRAKWKHVIGAEWGPLRRPHLTLNDKLLGPGRFAEQPRQADHYREGYLCGMIRGDGHLGSYDYPDRNGSGGTSIRSFRLALADHEPLDRTREYLAGLHISTSQRIFSPATKRRREINAISTSARAPVERIRDVIRFPRCPSADWCKGFLAGIYDAEGGYSEGILRISNTDVELLDWTASCLRSFGFGFAVEHTKNANGLTVLRMRGGLPEQLRFFHVVDPATRRKCDIDERAVKTSARVEVAEIEPLGEMELYDITTGTGDFIANGVVSHNCFARPTHTYLDFNAGRDFEREIVVKVNTPELARAELMRPRWKREHVALGTNTDPYQWVEKKYELMPGVWEAMRDSRTPSSVLTKSPLLLRDVELFKQIPSFAANLSIPTLEEKAWRASEPHTPHPRKRIEAVAELNRAGIPTGVLIAPLMPGINDDPRQVEEILERCAEAGAVSVGGICLHLRGEVRGIFMDWLRTYRPDLVEHYEKLYARGAYAPKEERERLSRLIRQGRRVSPDQDEFLTQPTQPKAAERGPKQTTLF